MLVWHRSFLLLQTCTHASAQCFMPALNRFIDCCSVTLWLSATQQCYCFPSHPSVRPPPPSSLRPSLRPSSPPSSVPGPAPNHSLLPASLQIVSPPPPLLPPGLHCQCLLVQQPQCSPAVAQPQPQPHRAEQPNAEPPNAAQRPSRGSGEGKGKRSKLQGEEREKKKKRLR